MSAVFPLQEVGEMRFPKNALVRTLNSSQIVAGTSLKTSRLADGDRSISTYHQERTNDVSLVGIEPLLLACLAEHVFCEFLSALDLGASLAVRNSCVVDEDVQILLL